MAVSATPASAAAAPTAKAAPGAVLQPGGRTGDGGPTSGKLDIAMLVMVVGVVGAITAPIAGRAHITRARSIRRFKGQLRDADLVSLCQQPIADDRHQPECQDSWPPGPRGS